MPDYEGNAASKVARRFAAAGIAVPEDRAEGAHAAARRLLDAVHWLRRPRDAAAEPANVFILKAPQS